VSPNYNIWINRLLEEGKLDNHSASRYFPPVITAVNFEIKLENEINKK
jgi:hypothetical protein